ncbi:uncharacterized protein LOC126814885 [Patella vulgata]|uniref:uncharacterized protein LOC126814885 n=1 Tax=Patella vulgata TaxID=6465 RepID=UPI0024A7A946|nr:uncharacterized protein LOC126814885 [Patella vulgata]
MNLAKIYIQYDSWWYYKGRANGVKTWVSRPDVFPQGSQYVFNQTGLPVSAHNRYWSSDTTYAKQNGGAYNFIVELVLAVPMDEKLWDDLFTEGRKWGLVSYEQDWLNDEFFGMKALTTDINNAKVWLTLMGKSARKNGITIQYCMSNCRHAMQSLELPAVTQARVSDDYSPGQDQWKIGISSIFAYAMGVAPFKDNFWSTTNQSGNPYSRSEPYNGLNAVVSTLSTGPVGPSDKIGLSNVSLIMRCCNDDGLILKPSKPATAIDSQIYQSAFGTGGPVGELWTTYSNIGFIEARHFGIILAADIQNTFQLTPTLAGFGNITGYKIFSMDKPGQLTDFSDKSPVSITPACSKIDFCLYYVSPVLKTSPEVVILGELSKWVPVSPQRVQEISQSDDIIITITGKQSESVTFSFSVDGVIRSINCVLGSSGTAQIHVEAMKCLSS